MKRLDAICNELLKEMCEDLGIGVDDASEDLKAMAMELARRYIAEN